MKKLLLISFMIGTALFSNAQNYRTSVGIKGNYSSLDVVSADLSVKHFFLGQNAFEINLGGGKRHFWLQAFYHQNQFITENLQWYWGLGPDVGYWRETPATRNIARYPHGFWLGLNGPLGLEYTFENLPLNVILDTGPTMRIAPEVFVGWNASFALRYTFK